MIPIIYIAGPYRAPTAWGISRNIHRAMEIGALVAKCGGYPVIPHSNTAHMDGTREDAFWLSGTMELLKRCDGVVMVPDWHDSIGSRAEYDAAKRLGLPIVDLEETVLSSERGLRIRVMVDVLSSRAP